MTQLQQPDLNHVVQLRRELVAEGFSDRQIAAMVRSRTLHRIRRGAYVDWSLWESLSTADRHRVLCRAVLRTSHPTTVLTHVSAVVERGVAVWGIPLEEAHTTRTDGKGARREAGVVHHVGVLDEGAVEHLHGVPVSPAARSAAEVIASSTPEAAPVVVNGLLHGGHMSYDDLAAAIDATKHWPHTLAARLVLGMADGRLESVAETRTYFLCRQQQLPRPEPQVVVRDESGRPFARTDFAWPEYGVFLEFDGRIKYERHRRDGESLEDYVMREKRREERICQLTGWVCIRIGWADLADPAGTAGRIRRLLESRRRPIGA